MQQIKKLRHLQLVKYLGMASTLSLVAAACGANASSSTASTVSSSSASTTVSVSENTTLGQKILVDSSGETLYLFGKDAGGASQCTGACATAWPPLLANGKVQAGAGISASLLGTIKRGNGDMQVTYNGHPLYTFSGDSSSGQVNGEGSTAFGAPWYAVSTQGSAVVAKASAPAASSAYSYTASPSTTATSGIPQGNGGDQDIDNNGGASDGDGNV